MYLNQNSIRELLWWVNNLEICNGKLILSPTSKVIIQSDASKKGWGVYCQKVSTGGRWTLQESNFHINVLELLAIKLALLTFSRMFKLRSVHFQVDNTTDSFISNEDGRHTKQGDDSQNLKVSGFGWFQAELGV